MKHEARLYTSISDRTRRSQSAPIARHGEQYTERLVSAVNCFQIIKTVLDETYAQIDIKGAKAKDKAISDRLDLFTEEYKDILYGKDIHYGDPVSRFAYIFRYVTSHANMVCDLTRQSDEIRALLKKENVSVSCVGGGPGSDLVGILKFLDARKQKPKRLTCFLLDRNKTWNECWCDLGSMVDLDFRLYTNFMELDVCQKTTYAPFAKYPGADLFTFVYFVSEVHKHMDQAKTFFGDVFSKMKPGALVLYIDNNDSRFYGWFDKMCATHGLNPLETINGRHQMPSEEEKSDLGEYLKKFHEPKLRASVAFRVARKG